jgi:hypothetical protein
VHPRVCCFGGDRKTSIGEEGDSGISWRRWGKLENCLETSMDAKVLELRERFERLLKETAEAATELDVATGALAGVPHFSVIELRAHGIGRQVSQMVQQRQMSEVVASQVATARCPKCRTVATVTTSSREVTSIDGPVKLLETKCHCDQCRRDFFPSA